MTLTPGSRLGPYEIVAAIGAGGMGEVYRARDPRLNRVVALKLLPAVATNDPERRERFEREAQAVAALNHPGIVTIHSVEQTDGQFFLTMELVEGRSLADATLPKGLSLDRLLKIAISVADAMAAAHQKGITHRDLKPANIMLGEGEHDGRVKVLDFGLAKLAEAPTAAMGATMLPTALATKPVTGEGRILGTVAYMSPEQAEGKPIDARSDLFSLGVILYEMATGQRPFTGETSISIISSIVKDTPKSVTELNPALPRDLGRIIRRALNKDPERRYQTAKDLRNDLEDLKASLDSGELQTATMASGSLPIGSGASTAAPGLTRRPRRAAFWGAMAGTVLTAAGFAAMVPWLGRRPTVPVYRQVTYRRGVVSSARFTPDRQSFVYSASWEGQPYAAFLGRPESPDARDLQLENARIVSISRAGDMAMLFGQQDISRMLGTRTLARVPMAGGGRRDVLTGVVDADWIPGTDTLAVIRDPGGDRPWTVEFPVGTTVHEARAAWSLRVSPDGNRVAFFEGPGIFDSAPESMVTVVDKSGQTSTLSRGLTGIGLAWAPSGSEIWYTAARTGETPNGPQLFAVSLAGVERIVDNAPDWYVLHDISADGSVLLSRNTIRVNVVCQAPGEATERDLGWLVQSLANGLSADGHTLIFSDGLSGRTPTGNTTVFRRRTDGSPAISIGESRGGGALSPDGQWVLGEMEGNLTLLPAGAGSTVRLPKGEVAAFGRGAWLGDSKRIVFTGDPGDGKPRGYIQEIPVGLPRAITPPGVSLAGKAAVRDDRFVLGRVGPTWRLFPMHGGEVQPVPALKAGDVPLQWSPDGRYVYTLDNVGGARSPAVDIFRVELTSGARVLWKTLSPSDPVGVETLRPTVLITPDAKAYCYSYMRRLGDLFVVDGLK